jgi:hypothetical protein
MWRGVFYLFCAAINVPFLDHTMNAFACGFSVMAVLTELRKAA